MTSDELELGPVDIAVIGYPADAPRSGEALPLLLDLVERGVIRILDVLAVAKAEDGSFVGVNIGDIDGDGIPDLIAFEGSSTGLVGDEDLEIAAEAIEPGGAAVMIVFENAWAAPFVTAVHRNGGHFVAFERVAAEDLIEAAAALDDADANA